MSEEMNQEKKCYKKLLIGGVIASLILSIAAMTLSVVTFFGCKRAHTCAFSERRFAHFKKIRQRALFKKSFKEKQTRYYLVLC